MSFNDSRENQGIQGHFYLPLRRAQKTSADAPGNGGFTLDVKLDLPGTGITGIFGRSGSGKTTLLRCIAGLQPCDEGHLSVNGETWQQGKRSRPAHRRPLGFVFQQPSLFPHLSARGNLEFACKRATTSPSKKTFGEIVQLMGIEPLLDQSPASLSGGEQQRIAIARALLIEPQLLLMDEPLASLDLMRKREILPYLENLHRNLDIPILYVSHSVDEIARLSDYLLLMDKGRLLRQGKATEILSRTDFPVEMGDDLGVLLEAEIVERDAEWQLSKARFDGGILWLRDTGEEAGEQIRVRVLARDVSLTAHPVEESSILNKLPAEVLQTSPDRDPAMTLVHLQPEPEAGGEHKDRHPLIARITRRSAHQLALRRGSRVWAQIKSVALVR